MVIHDDDMTAALPGLDGTSPEDTIFALRVRTSRLTSEILRSESSNTQ